MVQPRQICLFLALLTLLLYLPVRQHEFVLYDDPEYVTENWHVQSGLTPAGARWAFTTFYFSNWHPLTWLSHMLDCEVFGLNPSAHHVVNLLFHIANAVLLFLLLLRWTNRLWPSAIVAALFAWHPLHVESVAWISERKDVLSTLFWLLALWTYGRYAHENKKKFFGLTVLCLGLGLMAKPMLVTLPFVLVLLDYWPLGRLIGTKAVVTPAHPAPQRPLLQLLQEKWPLFLLAAASSIITFLAQRGEAVVSIERYPLALRLGNALVAYCTYVLKTLWPSKLAIIYPLPTQLPLALVLIAAAGLIASTFLLWRLRHSHPFALMGWLWFLGTLVPVIGIVQVGGQALADRYTYIPLVGLFIAAVWSARDLTARFRWRPAFPAAALGACLLLTFIQLRHWQDSRTLFTHALAVTKDNAIAQINLGLALEEAGLQEEALAHVREAIRIAPNRAQAYNNLGNLLSAMGKSDEAIAQYLEALRLKPSAPLVHMNLGAEFAGQNRPEAAMDHFRIAAKLVPDDPRPHYLMGREEQRQQHSSQAVEHFLTALRLNPNHPKALVQLARILASDPDPQIRNGPQAIELARKANLLTGQQQAFVLDTLAMAYAEATAFSEAIQIATQASQLAAELGDTESASAINLRLQSYQAGQPYRELQTNNPSLHQSMESEKPAP